MQLQSSQARGVVGEMMRQGQTDSCRKGKLEVLPCQEGAAKATGRTGPTGTGIESEREADMGLEFIFKMSISLSSANAQRGLKMLDWNLGPQVPKCNLGDLDFQGELLA